LTEEKLHLENAIAELQAEDSRLLAQEAAQRSVFNWKDLDQRLIAPKTQEIAEGMGKRAREEENRIAFKTAQRHSISAYLPRLIEFNEKLIDE
jgi:hypothetical protein